MNCIDQKITEKYAMYNGDCVEVIKGIPSNSVGLSVFSPPFTSIFVYSESDRDMGNCANDEEFMRHYSFLCSELMRVTIPGRICAVHCKDGLNLKRDVGFIGLKDFSGELIRAHEKEGWIYHSRVTVWKDPVVEMQRTKAIGLLHKQLKKDSTLSRMGTPDYVLFFRKPGEEGREPVSHTDATFPVEDWQKVASPVWMDIVQGNVLNARIATEDKDERHMCPLQLDLIERVLRLYSNKGDVVLSPFAGIGSEGVASLGMDRKFVGIELKESYFKTALRNLAGACKQTSLLDLL